MVLEEVIRRNLFDFFAVVSAAFVEEVVLFTGEDFDVEPLGFAQFFRVNEVGRVDAEDFQRVVVAVGDVVFHGVEGDEIQVAVFKDPAEDAAFGFERVVGEFFQFVVEVGGKQARVFVADDAVEGDTKAAVDFFFFRGRFYRIRYAFEQVAVFVERHDDEELAEERDMLHKQREHDQRQHEALAANVLVAHEVFHVFDAPHQRRVFADLAEHFVHAEFFEEEGVGVLVADFAFGKGAADVVDFRLGKVAVEVAPEALDAHFHLRDGEHGAGERGALCRGDDGFVVLDVAGEVEFGVQPVGMADGVLEFEQFRVFVGLDLQAVFKEVAGHGGRPGGWRQRKSRQTRDGGSIFK